MMSPPPLNQKPSRIADSTLKYRLMVQLLFMGQPSMIIQRAGTVSSPSRQTDVQANGTLSSPYYLIRPETTKTHFGQWTTSEDVITIQILNVANIDSDNDGVLDDLDMRPVGYGTDTYWYSQNGTDFDGDICR